MPRLHSALEACISCDSRRALKRTIGGWILETVPIEVVVGFQALWRSRWCSCITLQGLRCGSQVEFESCCSAPAPGRAPPRSLTCPTHMRLAQIQRSPPDEPTACSQLAHAHDVGWPVRRRSPEPLLPQLCATHTAVAFCCVVNAVPALSVDSNRSSEPRLPAIPSAAVLASVRL